MTGQRIKLGKGFRMKDGKLTKVFVPRDASHAQRVRSSKKVRVGKRTAT
jgi:hypothetical protein